MGNLSRKDRETLYLHLYKAYSQRDAYMITHPKCSESAADAAASRAFSRIYSVISTLPITEQLEICGLGKTRLWTELNKRLNAKTPIFWQKQQIAVIDDNTVQQRATELLAKIHGVDKGEAFKDGENKGSEDNTFVITDEQPELFD